LAIHLKDRVPEMEYVFCDTGKELRETYEYLARLEAYLGKPITRLNSERTFDHWLEVYRNYLPSPRMRWCTRMLKLKPFEQYCGEDEIHNYVGIRADEDRTGYISTKPNIKSIFPFKEDGITKEDIFRILENAGLGLPEYYSWRSRSGCYFCFFQRKSEWAGLLENHPDLFEEAKAYEKINPETGERYTWNQAESLDELAQPARLIQIRTRAISLNKEPISRNLLQILAEDDELDDEERPCAICEI
jgi:3'-phosphoadenosine 5'-phosphosulfate sulfotransferase (PAPS reductase)/FAD synthetase